tara:strand:+ start:145 stop:294 length:150 start_codon:yes stop_codon:yes gene_type:complete
MMSLSIKKDAYETAQKLIELVEILNEDGDITDIQMEEVLDVLENLQFEL